MTPRAETGLASLLAFLAAAAWGLYWLPVRRLAEAGVPGGWGSAMIAAVAAAVLTPAALRGRAALAGAGSRTLAALALGGVSFAMYSVALVHGRVAIVVLLFFLTPVWSTLIARFWIGWRVPPLRGAAILVGLGGLLLVLSGDGGAPLPRGASEWLGLLSGMLWSVATTGMRTGRPAPPFLASWVFALGGLAGAAALAPLLSSGDAPPVAPGASGLAWLLAAAILWWALSMAALLWAATKLEPARLGILQMSEAPVGVVSAALLAGEAFGSVEAAGGVLILAAAVLEVWPERPGHARPLPERDARR